jgi:hypothetical protein
MPTNNANTCSPLIRVIHGRNHFMSHLPVSMLAFHLSNAAGGRMDRNQVEL